MGRVSVDPVTLMSIDPFLPSVVESYCVPNFDSPSVFARILDKDKVLPIACGRYPLYWLLTCVQGGHFSISPKIPFTTKQIYLPSSNVISSAPFIGFAHVLFP